MTRKSASTVATTLDASFFSSSQFLGWQNGKMLDDKVNRFARHRPRLLGTLQTRASTLESGINVGVY